MTFPSKPVLQLGLVTSYLAFKLTHSTKFHSRLSRWPSPAKLILPACLTLPRRPTRRKMSASAAYVKREHSIIVGRAAAFPAPAQARSLPPPLAMYKLSGCGGCFTFNVLDSRMSPLFLRVRFVFPPQYETVVGRETKLKCKYPKRKTIYVQLNTTHYWLE